MSDSLAGRTAVALRSGVTAVDWPRAIALGIVSFPIGYLLTGLTVVVGGSTSGDVLGVLVLLGFVFYSALNVPASIAGGGQVDYLSAVAAPGPPVPSVPIVVYYAIPVIVLVSAGGLASVWILRGRLDPIETGLTVLGLAVGFAVMAILGSFVFVSATLTGQSAQPALGLAALFGFVYPLVFGLLGAALVQVVDAFRVGG